MPYSFILTRILAGIWISLIVVWLLAIPNAALASDDAQSYVKDAKRLLQSGDVRGAEIQLRNAVREAPGDPEIHSQLASLYLKLNNLPAAEAEAREARRDGGLKDHVDPLLAEALLRESKLDDLFRLVQPGNRGPMAESSVRLSLGLAHLTLREDKQAESLLEDAERLDEGAVGPKIGMARWLIFRGEIDAAATKLARAAEIAPDDRTIGRLEAEIMASQGNFKGAMTKFSSLLAKHADDLATILSRTNILLLHGDLATAQSDLSHALALAPQNGYATYLEAELKARRGDFRQADDLLSQISANFGNFPDGYYLQGIVKYALGQFEQARTILNEYISRNPSEPNSRRVVAMIDLRKGSVDDAILVLKPVVDANPAETAAVVVLAQAYMAAGRRNDAIELYEHASQAQLNDAKAETALAIMEARSGNTGVGLRELEKIAKTSQGLDVASPVVILGNLQSGDVAKAAAAAEAWVKADTNNPLARNLLGIVRTAQQRYPEAEAIFKDLIQKNPSLAGPRAQPCASLCHHRTL